jgi:hypothetical protein
MVVCPALEEGNSSSWNRIQEVGLRLHKQAFSITRVARVSQRLWVGSNLQVTLYKQADNSEVGFTQKPRKSTFGNDWNYPPGIRDPLRTIHWFQRVDADENRTYLATRDPISNPLDPPPPHSFLENGPSRSRIQFNEQMVTIYQSYANSSTIHVGFREQLSN